jgi:hypothetical protein
MKKRDAKIAGALSDEAWRMMSYDVSDEQISSHYLYVAVVGISLRDQHFDARAWVKACVPESWRGPEQFFLSLHDATVRAIEAQSMRVWAEGLDTNGNCCYA